MTNEIARKGRSEMTTNTKESKVVLPMPLDAVRMTNAVMRGSFIAARWATAWTLAIGTGIAGRAIQKQLIEKRARRIRGGNR